MIKCSFQPRIVIEGVSRIDARNRLLHILAGLEFDGKIYHFNVGDPKDD